MQIPSTLDKRFIPRNFDSTEIKGSERVKNFQISSGFKTGQTNSSQIGAFRYQKKQPELNEEETVLGMTG